ncbi:MAG: cytochrome c biogenesis protein CcdA [Actinobacteria bacterium]|nr:cytochrome c biogenesis protein CcdA [Actinomycetota bacterium]
MDSMVLAQTSQNVSYFAAFFAGLFSFLSPCVLPLVPVYLSVVSGVSVSELKQGGRGFRREVVLNAALFVLGFSVVFVIMGLGAGAFGGFFRENQSTITKWSGLFVMTMAVLMVYMQFTSSAAVLQERRFHPRLERFGPFATPIAGAAFGFGWTPCIGPTMGAVLSIAAGGDSVGRAGMLLLVYSMGLAVPFMATAIAFGRISPLLDWFKRHAKTITIVSAMMLFGFGWLLWTNNVTWLQSKTYELIEFLHLRGVIDWFESFA